jgi:hypothetical protein
VLSTAREDESKFDFSLLNQLAGDKACIDAKKEISRTIAISNALIALVLLLKRVFFLSGADINAPWLTKR